MGVLLFACKVQHQHDVEHRREVRLGSPGKVACGWAGGGGANCNHVSTALAAFVTLTSNPELVVSITTLEPQAVRLEAQAGLFHAEWRGNSSACMCIELFGAGSSRGLDIIYGWTV
jgi:hypothetical protein